MINTLCKKIKFILTRVVKDIRLTLISGFQQTYWPDIRPNQNSPDVKLCSLLKDEESTENLQYGFPGHLQPDTVLL